MLLQYPPCIAIIRNFLLADRSPPRLRKSKYRETAGSSRYRLIPGFQIRGDANNITRSSRPANCSTGCAWGTDISFVVFRTAEAAGKQGGRLVPHFQPHTRNITGSAEVGLGGHNMKETFYLSWKVIAILNCQPSSQTTRPTRYVYIYYRRLS